ncbi:unnamed protein product [Bursaphelenchus okinawaensis]|uniref:Chromo domain-containing protein n=1 Tax=Bursaphelenchus okinawaensis TaxID=465554 RepID=A0A811K5W8_9BILA|nr:unnamed protein product [Bursaphelenchus okinawaensis]CAG9092013.1 unnamed protein product [Bursaphelenchus okinawaensis]
MDHLCQFVKHRKVFSRRSETTIQCAFGSHKEVCKAFFAHNKDFHGMFMHIKKEHKKIYNQLRAKLHENGYDADNPTFIPRYNVSADSTLNEPCSSTAHDRSSTTAELDQTPSTSSRSIKKEENELNKKLMKMKVDCCAQVKQMLRTPTLLAHMMRSNCSKYYTVKIHNLQKEMAIYKDKLLFIYPDLFPISSQNEGVESSPEPEGLYKIEKILDHRIRNGDLEYLIKWENYPEDQDSYETVENLCNDSVYTLHRYFNERLVNNTLINNGLHYDLSARKAPPVDCLDTVLNLERRDAIEMTGRPSFLILNQNRSKICSLLDKLDRKSFQAVYEESKGQSFEEGIEMLMNKFKEEILKVSVEEGREQENQSYVVDNADTTMTCGDSVLDQTADSYVASAQTIAKSGDNNENAAVAQELVQPERPVASSNVADQNVVENLSAVSPYLQYEQNIEDSTEIARNDQVIPARQQDGLNVWSSRSMNVDNDFGLSTGLNESRDDLRNFVRECCNDFQQYEKNMNLQRRQQVEEPFFVDEITGNSRALSPLTRDDAEVLNAPLGEDYIICQYESESPGSMYNEQQGRDTEAGDNVEDALLPGFENLGEVDVPSPIGDQTLVSSDYVSRTDEAQDIPRPEVELSVQLQESDDPSVEDEIEQQELEQRTNPQQEIVQHSMKHRSVQQHGMERHLNEQLRAGEHLVEQHRCEQNVTQGGQLVVGGEQRAQLVGVSKQHAQVRQRQDKKGTKGKLKSHGGAPAIKVEVTEDMSSDTTSATSEASSIDTEFKIKKEEVTEENVQRVDNAAKSVTAPSAVSTGVVSQVQTVTDPKPFARSSGIDSRKRHFSSLAGQPGSTYTVNSSNHAFSGVLNPELYENQPEPSVSNVKVPRLVGPTASSYFQPYVPPNQPMRNRVHSYDVPPSNIYQMNFQNVADQWPQYSTIQPAGSLQRPFPNPMSLPMESYAYYPEQYPQPNYPQYYPQPPTMQSQLQAPSVLNQSLPPQPILPISGNQMPQQPSSSQPQRQTGSSMYLAPPQQYAQPGMLQNRRPSLPNYQMDQPFDERFE